MGEGIILIVGGVFILAAIGLHWDWFMNHYKVGPVVRILGEAGATAFYVFCGLALLIVGTLMVVRIID